MLAQAIAPNLRMEDWRQFGLVFLTFCLLILSAAMPDLAHAEGTFDGKFGPDATLVTNSDGSARDWWRFIAGIGLWVAIAGFAFSICFMKAQGWWIPVAIFLLCLFGEKTVNGVKAMAGFSTGAVGT